MGMAATRRAPVWRVRNCPPSSEGTAKRRLCRSSQNRRRSVAAPFRRNGQEAISGIDAGTGGHKRADGKWSRIPARSRPSPGPSSPAWITPRGGLDYLRATVSASLERLGSATNLASRRFATADLLKEQTPIFPMPSFAQRDATAQRGSCPRMPNALANS
jgi:hypothetical protein